MRTSTLGIETLAGHVAALDGPVDGVPEELVAGDAAGRARTTTWRSWSRASTRRPARRACRCQIDSDQTAVADARHLVTSCLEERSMPALLVADAALATSELVTNALVHGRPPVELRLRLESTDVLIEVRDRATYQPRKLRPDENDEHGRGLQIVAALASRWGTRPTEHGKAVWCVPQLAGLTRVPHA